MFGGVVELLCSRGRLFVGPGLQETYNAPLLCQRRLLGGEDRARESHGVNAQPGGSLRSATATFAARCYT